MISKKTTEEMVRNWITEPEGSIYEFKEAKNKYDIRKATNYCVALANEGGGKLILGITDKRPRKIVGTKAFPEPGETQGQIYRWLHRHVFIEEVTTSDGRVLVIHIPGRDPADPWHYEGRYLKRAGDNIIPIEPTELGAIFEETIHDYSAQICPEATLSDLDSKAISDFRERWAKQSGDERKLRWDDRETLVNAELASDFQLRFAALILFGTHQGLGQHLPQTEVVFEFRENEASGPAAVRREYRQGFFLFYDNLWNTINHRNSNQSYQDGLFRYAVPTFDEVSVREALLNAIAHRDYRNQGSTWIRQYPRQLEVLSPGGFPRGVSANNILDQQNPRNRRLSEALAKCGLVERAGQGVNLMYETAIKQGKPLPDYSKSDQFNVKLILNGTLEHPAFVRFLEKVGEKHQLSFSTYDFLTLNTIYREQPLTSQLKERLSGLIEAGAIESRGRGRGTKYILSRSLYTEMGKQGVSTRKKGLDHEHKKALLEKHLIDKGEKGTPMSELLQVLPQDNRHDILRMLRDLANDGKAHLIGQRRSAKWYYGHN